MLYLNKLNFNKIWGRPELISKRLTHSWPMLMWSVGLVYHVISSGLFRLKNISMDSFSCSYISITMKSVGELEYIDFDEKSQLVQFIQSYFIIWSVWFWNVKSIQSKWTHNCFKTQMNCFKCIRYVVRNAYWHRLNFKEGHNLN